MKPSTLIKLTLTISIAVSGLAVLLTAQDSQSDKPKHHRYKLVDLGTLGGPRSYVNPGSGNETGNYASVLGNRGTVAGFADTVEPDPFPSFCFVEDCFVSHAFEWKDGAKTDLGALTGSASSASNWISENGLIAGLSQDGKIDPLVPGLPEVHAVLWRNGTITDLGTLPEGGFESIASAVNNRGQVVGLGINTIADPDSMAGIGFQTRAFLWQDGTMQDLGTLGSGSDAQAILINDKGQVVGWSYTSSASVPGGCTPGFPLTTGSFIWDKNRGLRDLGSLGGSCTLAAALNNRGQVVGVSNLTGDQSQRAFIWDSGSIQDLGGSLGGDSLDAFAINDAGQAVGFANLPGNAVFHASLWKRVGDMVDLGVVGADQCSFAASINAKTQVVGTSGDCVSTSRVFLWEDGAMFDLNALIPPGSTLTLHAEFAETINDRGEIAGTGVDSHGNQHAFLAIPCDDAHPNIEGCDYSLVEGSTIAAAQAAVATPLGADQRRLTTSNAQNRVHAFQTVRNRQFGSRLWTGAGTAAKLSPTSLNFGTVAVGATSAPKAVMLTNVGATPLTVNSITITGTDSGDFVQAHTCGSSLAAGASCKINVIFKPKASGTRAAALSVSDNAAGSPQAISLSGIGTTAKFSPTSLNFGIVVVGTTSAPKAVTLTNIGTTSLTVNSITITGTDSGDFAQTHTCGSSLAAGATCTISVTFKPIVSGARTAALSISDNASGSPQVVPLAGGVLMCIPFGGFCYGPGGNHCCPAPYPHHSFCSDPTGWGTCIES